VLAAASVGLFSLMALALLHDLHPEVPAEAIPTMFAGVIAGGLASAAGFATTLLAVVRPFDPAQLRLRPGRETRLTLAMVVVGTLTLGQALDSAVVLLGLEERGTPALIRRALEGAAGARLVAAVIVVGVLVGLVEEAFFRGYMQTGLRARWPPWAAVLVTSAAFALLHVDWVALDVLHAGLVLALGLWLGFATERSDSALPAVAAHVINNSVYTLQSALDVTVEGVGANLALGAACAVVFAGCAAGVARGPR
jgi:membrane protease YdiL (CAAX protease family)